MFVQTNSAEFIVVLFFFFWLEIVTVLLTDGKLTHLTNMKLRDFSSSTHCITSVLL